MGERLRHAEGSPDRCDPERHDCPACLRPPRALTRGGRNRSRTGPRGAVRGTRSARSASDDDRANRVGRAPRGARAAQAPSRRRGVVRPGPEARPAQVSASRRHPHRGRRGGTRRSRDHYRRTLPGDEGRRLRDTRPGRTRTDRDRGFAARTRSPRGDRRHRAHPRRRQLRGSAPVQRRTGGRRSRPATSRWSRRSVTSKTRRSAISPPTPAPRRRPQRLRSSSRTRASSFGPRRSCRRLEVAIRSRLERDKERLGHIAERLRRRPVLVERRRTTLDHLGLRLQALSPAATLARGYAIVRSGGGALREAAAVSPGERLEIELASGGLGARVEEVRP